jgi:hypothetical protein
MGPARVRGNPSRHPAFQKWQVWAGGLVALYLLTVWAGWGRTLSGNEIWALYYAGRPLPEQMEAVRQDLVHPPLIYLIERGWLGLFGHTDSAAKSLPIVISVPSIVLFTVLARRVVTHWRLASFLFAGAYASVGRAASIVRMYGLTLLLVVAAMLLWDAWRKYPRRGTLAAWTAVMALLIYTHFCGLLLLASFLVVNSLSGVRRGVFAACAALAGLAYLPWLVYVLPVYESRGLEANLWWVRLLVRNPVIALSRLPASNLGEINIPSWRRILWPTGVLLNLALFVAAWKTIRQLPSWRSAADSVRWFWTSLTLFGFPVLLLFAFSAAVTPAFHSRFLLGTLPAYWILIVLLGQLGGRAGLAILYGAVLP